MRGRRTTWMAWGMWIVTILAAGPTLYLASLNEVSSPQNTAFVCVLISLFSTVGVLISSRRPENAIGWIFGAGSLLWMLGEFALEYGVYGLISFPGALPAAAWVAWFGDWARGFGWLVIVTFLLLLFPNGRIPGRRWRRVAWFLVAYLGFFTLASLLSPIWNELRLASMEKPIGVEGTLPSILSEAIYLSLPLPLLLSGAAVVARFRRSVGDERQQLKWFTYAVGVMVVVFSTWITLAVAGLVEANALTFGLPMLGLPIAVGIAILRHRLYDIDLIINRTLVYGALTALLALIYTGSVVLLQQLLTPLLGGNDQIVIVASTLAIAALFSPLRKRIQHVIDRRFYRRKYDAQQTLAAFSVKMRDEVDLDQLQMNLVAAVDHTMQPEHVSLWLLER